MLKKPNILVVGSFMMDLIASTKRAPSSGETVVGLKFQTAPGGKGANQAFALGRLGCPVAMVGAVGQDAAGDTLLESLQAAGVDCSCVARREAPTGQAFITVDSAGENAIIILAGANSTVSPADVEKLRPQLEQADCLVLQLEIPLETVMAAAKLARSLGKVVILDPAPAPGPLPGELLALCDYLKPNETELALLTGLPTATVEQCETAARRLLAQGVGTVLVSLGAKGALAVTPQEALLVAPPQVKAVDTTSAGDCFTAAFALRLVEGETSLEAALKFANTAAALTASRPGAQASIPARDEVEALLAAR